MAYSLETSSVKTIVPGAEVSGFADVVARQKINEVSGEVPQLSAGEGIDISTVDGKTVITNNISAGSNISLVYDMETNTYRIDGQGGGVDPASAVLSQSAVMPTLGLSYWSGVKISGGNETLYYKTIASYNTYISAVSLMGPCVTYLTGDSDVPTDLHPVTSEHWNNIITATKEVNNNSLKWNSTYSTVKTNSASWANAGHTYTGIAPIQVNNTTDEISITGESLSAGPGIDMFSSGGYVVVSSTGKELSAGPGIDLFESGGYFVISGTGGNSFPMTGTDGTANYTANANFSSFTLTTGQGAAGCYVNMNAKGVHFEAYPATDVSASWYSIITQQDKITCSAVKLSTASDSTTFYTSALPNLNKITFIAPSYGPYETYSALIDDGDTTFCAEVDSGCCRTVVRCWNDDRNKNCWCGLNQETYFYIG